MKPKNFPLRQQIRRENALDMLKSNRDIAIKDKNTRKVKELELAIKNTEARLVSHEHARSMRTKKVRGKAA